MILMWEQPWGWLWEYSGNTLKEPFGSLWGRTWFTLRLFWDHFGDNFGTTLVVVQGHFEGTRGVLWVVHRDHFGTHVYCSNYSNCFLAPIYHPYNCFLAFQHCIINTNFLMPIPPPIFQIIHRIFFCDKNHPPPPP